MELKTGLLILWILAMIQTMTCCPIKECDVIKRIDFTKYKMEELLKEYLSANGNEIRLCLKPISELDLKNSSSEEKMLKAQCGLNFIQKALDLILQHQRDLHDPTNPIFKTIITANNTLENTKHCVAKAICKCTNITEPDFQFTETYKRKQWGLTVLNATVDFLDELVNIV